MNVADVYFSVDDIKEIIREDARAYEIEEVDDLVLCAIDATLDYVVEWLKDRGSTEMSNLLHLLIYEE